MVEIEIDHRTVKCAGGLSVLRAAELNEIFIPSLCSHKDLSPFGGCRLCVVEIAGMRGYPLACSTIVQEGMKVLTDTATLREMRQEILQLILSEHPASCLICDEKDACRANAHTVRKAGVSTGCRYCPNDGQCELQSLAERLGVTDIRYPVYYRGYEPEHDDPFFDRDYNICILCGRCVRMCQEVRGTSVLAFKYRGSKTQIGPAFGRNHVEAGCEFCGACVSVCPTGTLAEKVSKWDGKPDGSEVSTCPFCTLGCQIDLFHRADVSRRFTRTGSEINDGQLCVRGAFCLPEITHHHRRARKPMLRRGSYFREVSWAEAVGEVAAHLDGVEPEEILMVVSPDLTNESLYAAQKLVRSTLKSNGIDSTARRALPGGPGVWADLFSLPISIKGVAQADAIIVVGLDSRFSFSVAGVEIRRALKKGATLVTIDPRNSNLARYSKHWLRPHPGSEGTVLRALAERLGAGAGGRVRRTAIDGSGVNHRALAMASEALAPCEDLAVIVGPTAFALDTSLDLATTLVQLGKREGTTILPLVHGANTRGALELGVFGELLPGLGKAKGRGLALADVVEGRARPKVLYLVGESPFFERPECDFLIAQDIYLPPFEVDAFLPAASFAEAEGTLTNIEGRVQRLVRVENLPDGAVSGYARPDWFIFGALAEKLGRGARWPNEARQFLEEISAQVGGFPASPDRRPRRLKSRRRIPWEKPPTLSPAAGEYQLVIEPGGFRHRGIDMSLAVEGLGELALEEGFRMHPDDLARLGLENGGKMTLDLDGVEVSGAARADRDCPCGTVWLYLPVACGGIAQRANLAPLYHVGARLLNVSVGRSGGPPRETAEPQVSAGGGES
jgi:predicted molibdopterin-dependent oxidoreductase YjgC